MRRHLAFMLALGNYFAAAILVASLFALFASPASAVIEQVKVGAETIEVGVQARQWAKVNRAPLQYHEGPIDPASYTYAIYWDPAGAYHSDWMRLIDGYLHDVGAASGQLSNPFALNGQYTGPSGTRAGYRSTFRGAYTDNAPYPATNECKESLAQPTCLTDKQIRAELKRFIVAEGLPTGREIVYFVLTPPTVTVCLDEAGTGACSTSDKEIEEEVATEETPNVRGPVANTTGFCGYHSVIEPASKSPIVYGVQPWIAGHAGHVTREIPLANLLPTGAELACQNGHVLFEPNQATSFINFDSYETGLADLIINSLSLEQSDIVVDPMLSNGWFQNGTNAEQADMCRGVFSQGKALPKEEKLEGTEAEKVGNVSINGDSYYLQYAYSSVGVTSGQTDVCWSEVELVPHFTATNPVEHSDIVAFDALESSMTLDANPRELKLDEPYTVPIYKWEFDDGTSTGPSASVASVFHSYRQGGEYKVTLTVTDSGGNVRSSTQTIDVNPLPPPPASTPSAGSSNPAVPGLAAVSGPGAGAGPQGFTLTALLIPESRKALLRYGVALRASANQPADGVASIFISAGEARNAHIYFRRGESRVVVGRGTIKGLSAGTGTFHLRLSKKVMARLRSLRRVVLTVQLLALDKSGQRRMVTVAGRY
jgi:PKD domain